MKEEDFEALERRLANYECEGQLSIFDMIPKEDECKNSINKEDLQYLDASKMA